MVDNKANANLIRDGLNAMTSLAHRNSVEKGWYEGVPFNVPEKLALIHSEVSEALEDYRVGKMKRTTDAKGKPEGFPSELADIVIRCGDLAGKLGIDLGREVADKMEFNKTRAKRHGGKKA